MKQASSTTSDESPMPSGSPSNEESSTDKATASFVRRVLCAHQTHAASAGKGGEPPPIHELLPPLTSSNEVDLQLYAFISILIKEYVHTWYNKISPDHLFVGEVVQIIAHCTRALEERARKIEYESLILNDVASIFEAHIDSYRVAQRAAKVEGPASNARLTYHTLRPHPALGPFADEQTQALMLEQQQNYSVYLQLLAQGIIAVLLPTEDLQNPCLRALVSEVAADLIIGNFIGNRISESIFVYDSIRKAANAGQIELGTLPWAFDTKERPKTGLSRSELLADRNASQPESRRRASVSQMISTLVQYAFLAFSAIRIVIQVLATSSGVPNRKVILPASGRSKIATVNPVTPSSPASPNVHDERSIPVPTPIVAYSAWSTGSSLTSFALRMPWLNGMISLIQLFLITGPGRLGETNNLLDRLLAFYVLAPLFPLSKYLPSVLLNLRVALFPNNTVPPIQPLKPTPEDASENAAPTARAKRAAAFAILNLIPKPIARIYFTTSLPADSGHKSPKKTTDPKTEGDAAAAVYAGQEQKPSASPQDAELEVMVAGVEDILDVFSDPYMNRHLVFAVMERVVVALLPELAEGKSVAELLADRGVDVDIEVEADAGGGGDDD